MSEKMNNSSKMHEHHVSRKKKGGTAKKIVLIALAVLIVLGGAGVWIVNHYFNRIQKIDLATETTISPEEAMSRMVAELESERAAHSLESDVAPVTETEESVTTEAEATDTETETEVESATEETERLVLLDPDATGASEEIVAIKETTTTAAPPPTTAKPTQPYVPVSYDWVKAGSLGDEYLINILLVGDDTRSTSSMARSDSILLLSVNPNSHKASLISFMRDMYVPIHDGYGYNRLNRAYEWGGIGFLITCLQQNFGLHIDGVVKINFWGFAKAVDTLGGIDISLNANEVKMMKTDIIDCTGRGIDLNAIHEGTCHLDGNMALAYCRVRKLDNDYNRTARQRNFLVKMFNKFKSSGAGTINNVMNTVLASCSTTMTNGDLASYAAQIIPYAASMTLNTYRLPAEGTFRDVVISGMQVLQSVQSKNIAALKSYLPW